MRILLVEDDLDSALVASRILSSKGHVVRAFHTGSEALKFAAEEPDLDGAVIDVVLPDVDGFVVARELMELRPHVRCVLVTGHSVVDGPARARLLGAGFCQKPVDYERIEALLALP